MIIKTFLANLYDGFIKDTSLMFHVERFRVDQKASVALSFFGKV
jgi:hypothetical protein